MRAGFWEILLIVVLVLILFGHAKIPDLMKNLANGLKTFKKELKSDDPGAEKKAEEAAVSAKTAPPAKKAPVRKPAPVQKAVVRKAPAKKPAVKK